MKNSTGGKRVALMGFEVIQPGHSVFNQALLEYTRRDNPWEFIANTKLSEELLYALGALECDGAMVRVTTPEIRAAAREVSFPVVNNSSWLEDPGVPSVLRDDYGMGVLAAEHLLERGFRHCLIVDVDYGWLIRSRLAGFQATLNAHGASFETYTMPSVEPSDADRAAMAAWLSVRKLPAGMLIPDGFLAQVVYQVVAQAGLSIPLDIAPISIIDEPTASIPVEPSLSYVDPDETRCCLAVAALLDRLMAGEAAPEDQIQRIPPAGIVQRESTQTEFMEDRVLAKALNYIHQHSHEPINASMIAEAVGVTPATLLRHFKKHQLDAPYTYLCKLRVDRAAHLLVSQPQTTLTRIAELTGFPDRNRFNQVFQRVQKMSPAQWRKQSL